MIKVEKINVTGWEAAVRGMRNPMNSWDKSDSGVCGDFNTEYKDGHIGCGHNCPKWSEENYCGYSEHLQKFPYDYYMLGPNDLDLMHRLYIGGPEHRKFMRMVMVTMDITAPLYWWKEFDTYKVGTVANSCSTMHKIHAKEFTLDDFSHEHVVEHCVAIRDGYATIPIHLLNATIEVLNDCRKMYLEERDKRYWWTMIQLLPSSYNQKRTVQLSYENAVTIIKQRTGHKLDEWNYLVNVLYDLPYLEEIMTGGVQM